MMKKLLLSAIALMMVLSLACGAAADDQNLFAHYSLSFRCAVIKLH